MLPRVIRTPRLVLRPPVPGDAPHVYERWTRDPEVTRYLRWRPHESIDRAHAFIGTCVQSWAAIGHGPWVLTRTGDDTPIGMIDARYGDMGVELGYVLGRADWGQGLMPEAATAVVEAALAEPDIYRVWAVCDVDNRASARVLEKAGMTLEGRLARASLHPNLGPEPRDVLLYARTW